MLAVDFSVLPLAKQVPTYTALGEPEHVDFKENLIKALTPLCDLMKTSVKQASGLVFAARGRSNVRLQPP